MSSQSYEGKQDNILLLKMPEIESFKNIYFPKTYLIKFKINEFTAICPKTGLPDFGKIYIHYQPNKLCLELKSLKEYFFSYREIGIFHENVVNKVFEDITKTIQPTYLKIKAIYNIRGGIKTVVERSTVKK